MLRTFCAKKMSTLTESQQQPELADSWNYERKGRTTSCMRSADWWAVRRYFNRAKNAVCGDAYLVLQPASALGLTGGIVAAIARLDSIEVCVFASWEYENTNF